MRHRSFDNSRISSDVARRGEVASNLGDPEARYRALVEHVPAITYVAAADELGRVMYVTPRVETVLGYAPEEWLLDPRFLGKLLHPEDRERVTDQRAHASEGGNPFSMEYRLAARDGRTVWVRDEAVLVQDENGRPLCWQGILTDITEHKVLEERLRHQALHDPLTNLPNRALLLDRLEHALARAERSRKKVAVLFLDLDNFKHVNDSLGHEAGNRLLVEVAARLRMDLRAEDTVARLGGDEFVVLREGLEDEQEVVSAVRRIVQALRPTIYLDEQEIFVTASIGVALGSCGATRPEDLMRDASVAKYRAKVRGKDRDEVYRPEMGEISSRRLALERDLRRAVAREELVVYYQPKVQIETGETVGVEALARWEHPEQGLLHPAEFLPLAEETGLIIPIGRWVLKEACRQAKEWQRHYSTEQPLALYVNVSARQFDDPDLVGLVAEVLRETGLEASSLVLEITEHTAMGDAPSTLAKLHALKKLGLKLAIDDFGKGYSSLSYLKHFPVDIVKIDRSIVAGLGQEEVDSAIMSATVTLAHALGLEVIAEGTETEEAAAELRVLGCDFGQGYYWSSPAPARVMTEILETS